MVCTNFLKIECIFLYIYYNIAFLKSIPTRRMSFRHFGTFFRFFKKMLDIFCRKNPVRPNDLTGYFSFLLIFLLIIDNTTFVLSQSRRLHLFQVVSDSKFISVVEFYHFTLIGTYIYTFLLMYLSKVKFCKETISRCSFIQP